MAWRGWRLAVDGVFGPRSARVARRFQREKGLIVDGLVGPQTWAAAWRLPVTR
jgi:peptidoglycan hydrolase-like protein with peptidoglycan-binding domain